MNKKLLPFLCSMLLSALTCFGQLTVPQTSPAGGPLNSAGSWLVFPTGSNATSVQENWGLNLCGSNVRPVRIYNASLLIGYTSYSTDFSTGNLLVSGNVGIGTTDTKGYKLGVNGSLIATSVTVKLNTSWPDYVFKPSYTLPPLTDIKNYIDKNHHLPEMPSEAEVATEGINLGEMNKLLLKKVEELTLYMIEAKEEINDLKKQVQDLKKAN